MPGTILVTGATGTFGREVVRELLRRRIPGIPGSRIRAAVHSEKRAKRLDGLDVERVELDFSRPETVAQALAGVEKLFLVLVDMPDQGEVAGRIAGMAREAGVRHLVKLSAQGADNHTYTLGDWHGDAERAIREAGVPWTFLRPNSLMQNFKTFFRPRAGRIYLPLGQGKVSYVDARDVGEAAAVVLTSNEHEGEIYELTGPEAISIGDVADTLTRVTGEKVTYVDVPPDTARRFMEALGQPEWLVSGVLEMHAVNKAGEYAAVFDAVERLTGRPARTFEQFVTDYADAFREKAP